MEFFSFTCGVGCGAFAVLFGRDVWRLVVEWRKLRRERREFDARREAIRQVFGKVVPAPAPGSIIGIRDNMSHEHAEKFAEALRVDSKTMGADVSANKETAGISERVVAEQWRKDRGI